MEKIVNGTIEPMHLGKVMFCPDCQLVGVGAGADFSPDERTLLRANNGQISKHDPFSLKFATAEQIQQFENSLRPGP